MWRRITVNYFGASSNHDETETGPTLSELKLQAEAREKAARINAAFDKLVKLNQNQK